MIIPILQFILSKGAGDAMIKRFLTFAESNGVEATRAVCLDPLALSIELRINEVVSGNIISNYENAIRLYDLLNAQNVQIVWQGHPNYPIRLKNILEKNAPPYLFVRGNIDLLNKISVGFCGSRKSSEKGLFITSQCAEILAEKKICVVSGYAKGVDLVAHSTAMRMGGETIIVLAEGILRFSEKNEVRKLFLEKNHLIVSQFPPNLTWIARNAMKRNHVIIGLSDAMILIEAGKTGGTFAAGEATLQHRQPLFVVNYGIPPESASGNNDLFMKGGILLQSTPQGKPSLGKVINTAKEQFQVNSVSKNDNLLL